MGIRLGVVAGDFTNDIVNYLDTRAGGSLDIEFKCSSLLSIEESITRGRIKLDKLIYIIQNNVQVNIRSDMNFLGKLLEEDNRYFKVNEILLFVTDGDISAKGLDYFEYIVRDVEFSNYNVIKCGPQIANDLVFKHIFNQKTGEEIRTKRKKMYRVEINSDTKKSYDVQDNDDLIIEPVTDGNVKMYDEMKKVATRSESGVTIVDDKEDEIPHNDAYLGRINISLNENRKYINIVSGESKSGISTYSSAMAVSAYEANKSVLVIDCSRHCGTKQMLREFGDDISILYCDMQAVLCDEYDYKNYEFIVADCAQITDKSVWVNYVKFLVSILPKINPDIVIIDCDEEYLNSISEFCNVLINKIFICCQVLKSDVQSTSNIVNKIKIQFEPTILLNDCILNLDGYEVLTALDVEEIMGKLPIVNPIEILDLNIGSELHDVLLM